MLQTRPKPCKYCLSTKHTAFTCLLKPRLVKPMPKVGFKFEPCKVCGSKQHYASFCPSLAKKPIGLRKRMKARGKTYTRWNLCKSDWFQTYPAGHYICHYCGKYLSKAATSLDHKIPRSLAPELRYDFTNLVPCCWNCNGLKASTSHDDYPHICH